MNPRIETPDRVKTSSGIAAALILTVVLAGTVLATPVTFNLNYETSGPGTAAGTFTVDDSLLAPDIYTMDLADLLCFEITITVPGAPVQSFTKADLVWWTFDTDATGGFEDVNFSMSCDSREFIIGRYQPLWLEFWDCSQGSTITVFEAHPERGGVCGGASAVPTLSLAGLVALLLLVGVAAGLVLRRGGTLG